MLCKTEDSKVKAKEQVAAKMLCCRRYAVTIVEVEVEVEVEDEGVTNFSKECCVEDGSREEEM